MQEQCPCKSGKPYAECCQQYHQGKLPENALQLMRSRYSAYALSLADYIMDTTHPSSSTFKKDKAKWKEDILKFSKSTNFQDLTILEFTDGPRVAFVKFVAHLNQSNCTASFTEHSRFLKVDGKWLYESGSLTAK